MIVSFAREATNDVRNSGYIIWYVAGSGGNSFKVPFVWRTPRIILNSFWKFSTSTNASSGEMILDSAAKSVARPIRKVCPDGKARPQSSQILLTSFIFSFNGRVLNQSSH